MVPLRVPHSPAQTAAMPVPTTMQAPVAPTVHPPTIPRITGARHDPKNPRSLSRRNRPRRAGDRRRFGHRDRAPADLERQRQHPYWALSPRTAHHARCRRSGRGHATRTARPVHHRARLCRPRRAVAEARSRASRHAGLPRGYHDHRRRPGHRPSARARQPRPAAACLAGMPTDRRGRGISYEPGGPRQSRRPLFRPAPRYFRHRPGDPALAARRR